MGVVYLAEDLRLSRRVALKVLSPDLSAEPGIRDRFARESRIAASLDDPNIVPIHEAGEADGLLYIAMRYVEGTDLGKLLAEEGALDPHRALTIVSQVASALDAAHGRGLVHRDVKPANILLVPGKGSRGEHVYLSDFGLTKRVSSDSGVTKTGQFLGTLKYAAPEQFEGKPLDQRADVYSLGCVLFECLTGEIPFRREQDAALMYAHLNEPPPKATSLRPDLPREVDAVIARAMAKRPEDRFQTAGDLAISSRTALQGAVQPSLQLPGGRRPPKRWMVPSAAAGLAVVAVVLAVLLTRGGPGTRPAEPSGSRVTAQPLPPNTAAEIDPVNGKRLKTTRGLPVGNRAGKPSLATGEGGVWEYLVFVGVAHIDPATAKVRAVISLPGGGFFGAAIDSAVAFRTVYVPIGQLGESGALARIDPATDSLLSTIRFRSAGTVAGLTSGDGALWVAFGDGTVGRFDPRGHRLGPVIHLGGQLDRIVFGAGGVWVVDRLDGRITRLDPRSGKIVRTITTSIGLDDLAAGEGAVWVVDHNAGTVTPIDPSTNQLGSALRVGNDPSDIAAGLGAVWVTDRADGAIYKIDPGLKSVSKIPVGGKLVGIAVDRALDTLWVATGPA
jgi:serine/threonine-protein kinase